ncbi:MAG: GPR endopeptidase [Bacteroides sp.]|nr:GPR endopeptidase [Bacillota bacterium]MCM1394139.1 GPR endopeptidase [[Eubacterium] siraeum]MCM1455183.1 GPR endopeptidase [Bacteroides sp.]
MKNSEFISDMAIEAAEANGLKELSKRTELSCGIVQHYLNIKSLELAKQVGRERGVYITFDCNRSVYDSERAMRALATYISTAVTGLIGTVRKTTPILVVGLGNGGVIADALGKRAVDGIEVTKEYPTSMTKQCVYAMTTGVLGTTGMQSADIAGAVADRIKPSTVILIDSLATGTASRVGTSFQISTAGISPGGGVGQDKQRIDKSVLGVPVVAIGVPLMLSMRTAVYGIVKDYVSKVGGVVDEYKLRAEMADKNLSNLVVSPKEIDFLVDASAGIIATALNKSFA